MSNFISGASTCGKIKMSSFRGMNVLSYHPYLKKRLLLLFLYWYITYYTWFYFMITNYYTYNCTVIICYFTFKSIWYVCILNAELYYIITNNLKFTFGFQFLEKEIYFSVLEI